MTTTDSLSVVSASSVSSCVSFAAPIRIGRAARPSGSTAINWTGIGGVIGHRKRPSLSVLTDPRWPTMVISAPAIGVPLCASTRRPAIGRAGSSAANATRAISIGNEDIGRQAYVNDEL